MAAGADVAIGLDVGQRVDPTAIVVAESVQRETGRIIHSDAYHREHLQCGPAPHCRYETETQFIAHSIGRLPLGTSYPQVAVEVANVVEGLNAQGIEPTLRVDATGVGQPLVDILRDGLLAKRYRLVEVVFTGGDHLEGGARSRVRVPKWLLVSRLQALIQTQRIRLPRSPEAKALARELETFEVRISETAAITGGAFRTGSHDDLVVALGLAVLLDPTAYMAYFAPSPLRW
jgi:hypothetical protein